MKASDNPIDRWSVYTSAGLLSFCGVLVFSIMPLVASVIQRRYGFREAETGDVIACYFGGVTVVSLTTFRWIRRLNWRATAIVGQVLAITALSAAAYAANFLRLAMLMSVAGVGAGITYALVLTILGDSDDADRAFSINLLFQAVPVVVLMLGLPRLFSNDASDMRLLSLGMGATILLFSIGIFWLPKTGTKNGRDGIQTTSCRRVPGILPLAGITVTFLFMVGCTAPWTFIEEAARAKGIAPLLISYGLAGAAFAAVVGSVIAAFIGDRFGKFVPVCIGGLVYLTGIYLLHIFVSFDMFAVAAFLYYLPSNFLLAFSLGITAEVDFGGRLIGLSTASVFGPSLVCPPIAGRLYEMYGFASNLVMGGVCVACGILLYGQLIRMSRASQMLTTARSDHNLHANQKSHAVDST